MNTVILIGRLTVDPELKTSKDTVFTRFNLAVDRPGQDKGADFPSITVFGKQAESAVKYLSRGRKVAVQGRINTSKYEKDGKTMYDTSVIADRVEYLEWGDKAEKKEEPEYNQIEERLPWD